MQMTIVVSDTVLGPQYPTKAGDKELRSDVGCVNVKRRFRARSDYEIMSKYETNTGYNAKCKSSRKTRLAYLEEAALKWIVEIGIKKNTLEKSRDMMEYKTGCRSLVSKK